MTIALIRQPLFGKKVPIPLRMSEVSDWQRKQALFQVVGWPKQAKPLIEDTLLHGSSPDKREKLAMLVRLGAYLPAAVLRRLSLSRELNYKVWEIILQQEQTRENWEKKDKTGKSVLDYLALGGQTRVLKAFFKKFPGEKQEVSKDLLELSKSQAKQIVHHRRLLFRIPFFLKKDWMLRNLFDQEVFDKKICNADGTIDQKKKDAIVKNAYAAIMAGASINATGPNQLWTHFQNAVRQGNWDLIKKAVRSWGADIEKTSLSTVAQVGQNALTLTGKISDSDTREKVKTLFEEMKSVKATNTKLRNLKSALKKN